MSNLSLKTTTELLRLRQKLDTISQVSWSFSVINKKYPIERITEEQGREVTQAYQDLISTITNLLKSEYEREKSMETADTYKSNGVHE